MDREPRLTDPGRIACFFSTSGHSGVDRVARNLIPALAGRGYRVDLLKVRGHGPEIDPVPAGVSVVDLGSRHTYACLPALVRRLAATRPVAMLSDKDRVNRTALLARALARVETRLYLRLGTTVSTDLASRGALERWIQRTSMGRLYPLADGVLVNARATAEDLSRYTGLDPRHIRVVPNPAVPESLFDTPRPRPDHPWLAPGEPPVILGVGELGARKDFATLVRAFARVRGGRVCRLIILGRGGQRELLLRLGRELGVAADLDLPGFVSNPIDYMAHAAVLAHTSLWEGNPLVLVEALAVGTPVAAVAGDGGTREVLADGRYGPLVAPRDPEGLALAIEQVLTDPLPAQTLSEAARPYAVEAAVDRYLDAMGLAPRAPGRSPPGEVDAAGPLP
jgi:glycosyltransferase involved in cell wall biosynthesis